MEGAFGRVGVFAALGKWRALVVGYYVLAWAIGLFGDATGGSYGAAYPLVILFGVLFWLLPAVALSDLVITLVRASDLGRRKTLVRTLWALFVLGNFAVIFCVL